MPWIDWITAHPVTFAIGVLVLLGLFRVPWRSLLARLATTAARIEPMSNEPTAESPAETIYETDTLDYKALERLEARAKRQANAEMQAACKVFRAEWLLRDKRAAIVPATPGPVKTEI